MSPHELETMSARWLSTTVLSASSRSLSMQEAPPTYTMFASGATACTASTSRLSSPYQPAASQSVVLVYSLGRTWDSWPFLYALPPLFAAYCEASAAMVGEA